MKKTSIIVITTLILVAFIGINSVSAQTQSPPPSPVTTATPEVISTLQSAVATQQVQIDEQKRDISHNADDLTRAVNDWQWKWGIVGLIAGALGTIAISIGWDSITNFQKKLQTLEKDFDKQLNRTEQDFAAQLNQAEQAWATNLQAREVEWGTKSQLALNKVIDKFDPSKLPVYVPKELAALRLGLEHRGFKPVEYQNIEKIPLNGVIVIRIDSDEDETKFKLFLDKAKPNPKRTAFLLYAVTKKVSSQVTEAYENLIASNFPASAITNIIAIGRDLDIDEPQKGV